MSVAARVSQEMGVKLGHEVCGICYYSVSFFLLMFLFILPSVGLYVLSHHALYDVIFTVTWIAVGRIRLTCLYILGLKNLCYTNPQTCAICMVCCTF